MNHTHISETFETYVTNINYLASSHSNISLILSETGSALGGDVGLTTSLGAALWSVDFHLYAMSVGVQRIGGSQRPATAHALWTPIPGVLNNNPTPQVRSPFYAQPFIADFIGIPEPHSVLNLDLNSDVLSAYAMYHNSVLSRVALVNLQMWTKSSGTTRGSQTFAVSVPSGISTVMVQRLHADAGALATGYDYSLDASQNITWAGMQWTYTLDNGKGHISDVISTNVSVVNGVANVVVPDSEAVIVYL